MNIDHKDWRTCDLCGYEGLCRPATQDEIIKYNAEDVCQRCDVVDKTWAENQLMEALLTKIRDSGQWFHSALELDHDVDGEQLLKEIEDLVGVKQ